MSEWQPIETAPFDGTQILVCDARVAGWFFVASWEPGRNPLDSRHFWTDHEGRQYAGKSVTHWMPLPEPPTETGDQS